MWWGPTLSQGNRVRTMVDHSEVSAMPSASRSRPTTATCKTWSVLDSRPLVSISTIAKRQEALECSEGDTLPPYAGGVTAEWIWTSGGPDSAGTEPSPNPNRCRHRKSEQMAILLGLASPKAVLAVIPSEPLALLMHRAGGAQQVGLSFPAGSSLRAFGFGWEEQFRPALTHRMVPPVISGRQDLNQ